MIKNTPQLTDSVILFHIDEIGQQPIEDGVHDNYAVSGINDNVKVTGWCIDIENLSCVKSLLIDVNGVEITVNYGKIREDVARAHENRDYTRCGFECEIPRELLQERGNNQIRLIANSITRKTIYSSYYQFSVTAFWSLAEALGNKNKELEIQVANQNNAIQNLELALNDKEQTIVAIKNSISWKISKPLRLIGAIFIFLKFVFSINNIKAGIQAIKNEGIVAVIKQCFDFVKRIEKGDALPQLGGADQMYEQFLEKNKLYDSEIAQIKKRCVSFSYQPKISIVSPVYNVDPVWLKKCVASVKGQYYENWELCLYDDASTNKETIKCLKEIAEIDKRIKISFGKENKHISTATNQAISLSTGEYVGFLDNDDELTPDALYEVVLALNEEKYDFIYSDEDKISVEGKLSGPYFKSDFNIDLIRSNNYICHFSVVKKSIGEELDWLRNGFEGSQDHDFILRVIDKTNHIKHIPKVLYHWRMIAGSTAMQYSDKDYAYEAGKKAIEEHLTRNNIAGEVLKGKWGGAYRVKRTIEKEALVSIIIPFKDNVDLLKQCVDSILNKTSYTNYEILLISNNSTQKKTFTFLDEIRKNNPIISYYEHNVPFNFSAINNWAVQQAKGTYILLLNDDTEVLENEWLSAMVEHIQRTEVGAVGAKLLYPNNTLQHAGVTIGIGGVAGHAFKGFQDNNSIHFTEGVIKNLSACTGACLLVKKEVYEEVGGLDEENLKIAFNDIDFCLKIREKGYLIVYTPYALLYHHESISRGYEDTPEKKKRFEKEHAFMRKKWTKSLDNDPYYNINLTKSREDFSLDI